MDRLSVASTEPLWELAGVRSVLSTGNRPPLQEPNAEPYKKEIKQILLKEKATLCSNKTFQKVFENIDFNIAFSNSKNIKQLIVRTKI